MVMSVNTNVLSLTAQRSMMSTQKDLSTSIERLSTGLRINSAKDDAAGLAIGERFTSSIRGGTVAQRNANDGISFAQTAEGALDVIGSNLQRIRELAVQSLNDSNTDADRAAIDQEVKALKAEVDRIAKDTTFNGRNILDGSLGTMKFQIGAERGQTLDISGKNARASELGQTYSVTTSDDSVTDQDYTTVGTANDLTLNGVAVDLTGVTTKEGLVDAINNVMSDSGVQATLSATNELELSDASGTATTIAGTAALLAAVELDATDGGVDDFRSVSEISVATRDTANTALAAIDTAIDQITAMRADLGATQNRFENVIEVAGVQIENLSNARSRIQDADFAAETANLTRAQILQQAGLASLAQANSSPQAVLSLLG
ncbi:MAG: flagellin [Pseudomonadales bacterium]|jgi:flagellin